MLMQDINSLQGMSEFKELCSRLITAADNAFQYRLGTVPLPNLIFAAAPGCGVTLHIRMLTSLLKELRLLQFVGEEECFEWAISDDDEEFDRFLKRVRRAGGFYGQFQGVVGLDISDMLEGCDRLPPMERLMEYIEARQGKILFVLIVPDDIEESLIQQLLARFASISPAEVIRMPFPRDEAAHYVTQQLQYRGFAVSPKADALLVEVVDQLCDTEQFEGYQTLLNLVEEIIWQKVSQGEMRDDDILKQDVDFIFEENGYISRLKSGTHKARRRMGFGAAVEG